MIAGHATPEGTARYARSRAGLHADHWRPGLGLTLPSVGLGSYLGNPDAPTDAGYAASTRRALQLGINLIDSAINYRFQRSERAIGAGLRQAIDEGQIARDEVVVCTKGGFLAGDNGMPGPDWFRKTFVDPGIAKADDIVAGCHCMTPAYLEHEVDQSRRNLGLETIDLYYVHNPETQIEEVGADEFYRRLTAAFRTLEACASAGKIRAYGAATWDAFRAPAGDPSQLSLERVIACAREAGGGGHRFRAIQLPFNLSMTEAYSAPFQPWKGGMTTALEIARESGLAVFASVPLLQGRLLGRFTPELKLKFPGLATDAQRSLQFVRSTPGLSAPLAGSKDPRHVEENAGVAAVPRLADEAYRSLFP